MLYKKVHRQYLREFRVGRRFRFYDDSSEVHEVTRKPEIGLFSIRVSDWDVISMVQWPGKMWLKDNIEWLDRCYIRRFIDNFLESLR